MTNIYVVVYYGKPKGDGIKNYILEFAGLGRFLIIFWIIVSASSLFAQEYIYPNKKLTDEGLIEFRRYTVEEAMAYEGGDYFRASAIASWSDEIPVSDSAFGHYHHSAIAASDSMLHILGDFSSQIYFPPHHYVSYDRNNWEFFADYSNPDVTTSTGPIKTDCDENILYTVWKRRYESVYNTFIHFRASFDHGYTWPVEAELVERPQHWIGAKYGNVAGHGDTVFVSFIEDSLTCWHSYNAGVDWSSPGFIASKKGIGYPPSIDYQSGTVSITHNDTHDMAGDSTIDVFYVKSDDQGVTWSEPVMLGFVDSSLGQWPEVDADSYGDVAVCWMDYKDSPYGWTGGIWCRISNDCGQTWNDPVRVDDDYKGWAGASVVIEGDYVAVAWIGSAVEQYIYFRESFDGGETWGDIQIVAYGYSFFLDMVYYDNSLFLTWVVFDGVGTSIKYSYCDNVTSIDNEEPMLPSDVSLYAYPNPFNSTITMHLSGLKGGDTVELSIYDIAGSLVKSISTTNNIITWDATDAAGEKVCSGIYFARARTPQYINSLKLTLIK